MPAGLLKMVDRSVAAEPAPAKAIPNPAALFSRKAKPDAPASDAAASSPSDPAMTAPAAVREWNKRGLPHASPSPRTALSISMIPTLAGAFVQHDRGTPGPWRRGGASGAANGSPPRLPV